MKLILTILIITLTGCSTRESNSQFDVKFDLSLAPGINSVEHINSITSGSEIVSGRFVDYICMNGRISLTTTVHKLLSNATNNMGEVSFDDKSSLRMTVIEKNEHIDRSGSMLAVDTKGRELFSKIKSSVSINSPLIFLRDASGQMETYVSLDESSVIIIKRRIEN
jgi:hypothetical protein